MFSSTSSSTTSEDKALELALQRCRCRFHCWSNDCILLGALSPKDHQKVGQRAVKTTQQPCIDKPSAQRRLILRSYDNETLLIALHQPCSHPAGARDPTCMPSTQSLAMQMVCLATTVCLAPGEMSPAWLTSHRTSPWLSRDRQGCLKHTHEPKKLSTRVLQLS